MGFFLIDFFGSDEVNELMFDDIEIDKAKSASLLSLSCSTQLNSFYHLNTKLIVVGNRCVDLGWRRDL